MSLRIKQGLIILLFVAVMVLNKDLLRGTYASGLIIGLTLYICVKLWNKVSKTGQKTDERELYIIGKTSWFISIAMALYFVIMLVLVEKKIVHINAETTLEISVGYMAAAALIAEIFNRIKN